jgi:hypothetical protein
MAQAQKRRWAISENKNHGSSGNATRERKAMEEDLKPIRFR